MGEWDCLPLPTSPHLGARMTDTAGNPSQTDFCLHWTDPLIGSAPSPPAAILYDGRQVADMSAAEFISNIWSFMHSSSRIAAARNLRGEEAQSLVDLIDQVRGAYLKHNDAGRTEHGT